MKRTFVAMMVVALLSAQAQADDRDTWQIVFASSVTLAVGGGVVWWYGTDKVQQAEQQLCDGGVEAPSGDCTPSSQVTLTQAELDRINERGDRAAKLGNVGIGITAVGLGIAGFSLYKWMTAKPKESALAITPTVTKDGAGAQMLLRW